MRTAAAAAAISGMIFVLAGAPAGDATAPGLEPAAPSPEMQTLRDRAAHAGFAPPPPEIPGAAVTARPAPLRRGEAPSEAMLRELLQRHRGNIAAVGRELGRERMQVHRWLRRYEIDVEPYRR